MTRVSMALLILFAVISVGLSLWWWVGSIEVWHECRLTHSWAYCLRLVGY